MFFVLQFDPVADQVAEDVGETYTQGEGHGQDDTAEDYEKTDRHDGVSQPYIFEDYSEGDDDQEDPHPFGDEISILDPGVLAGQIDDPAQEIAEYDTDDEDDQRHYDVGKGRGDPGSILGELSDPHVVEPEGQEEHDEDPVDDLAQDKRRRTPDAAFLKKGDHPRVLRPSVKPEKNEHFAEKLLDEPAYDESQDHHDDHHDDAEEDLLEIIEQVQEHVLKKLHDFLHANILCKVFRHVNGNWGPIFLLTFLIDSFRKL